MSDTVPAATAAASSEPIPSHEGAGHGPARKRRRSNAVVETIVIVIIALLLSWLIKTFLVQPFSIPSASMNNVLIKGDRVLVSKLVPTPFNVHRGDVVVFKDSQNWLKDEPKPPKPTGLSAVVITGLTTVGVLPQDSGQHLIKRVIGIGGDEVRCCTDAGLVEVNGEAITEPYIKPGSIPSERKFDVVVPADSLWVMGDNRQNSADSRYHLGEPGGGFVPLDDVVGSAFVRIWPANRWALMRNPGDTFADVPDAPAQASASAPGAAAGDLPWSQVVATVEGRERSLAGL